MSTAGILTLTLTPTPDPPQSYEEATAPLEETRQNDEDEDFSLHFQLGEMKVGLSEIRDKMEDMRTGESRPRGSGELNLFNPFGVTWRGWSLSQLMTSWLTPECVKPLRPLRGALAPPLTYLCLTSSLSS